MRKSAQCVLTASTPTVCRQKGGESKMGDKIPTNSDTPKKPEEESGFFEEYQKLLDLLQSVRLRPVGFVLKMAIQLLASKETSAADREAKLQILKLILDLERGETQTYREAYQQGYRDGFSAAYQAGFRRS